MVTVSTTEFAKNLRAMGDLYRTLPEDAAAEWAAESRIPGARLPRRARRDTIKTSMNTPLDFARAALLRGGTVG